MNTVTHKEFLKFEPCWLEYEDGAERIKAYFDRFGGKMSALDILNLDEGLSAYDKLYAVLREEFIPAPILHEFACVCAENALSFIENPDPRSIKAIEVKRAWIHGKATDEELHTAYDAANAAYVAARAARSAAKKAAAHDSTWVAARAAERNAEKAAWGAAKAAAYYTARDTSFANNYDVVRKAKVVREAQVAYLIMTLED